MFYQSLPEAIYPLDSADEHFLPSALLPDNRAVLFESNVCMRPFSINPSIHLQTARERIHIAYLNQIYTKVKK